ncbi:diguanylate cyclase domain-containing protein [Pseudorhodoferax sp.]|uniref:diguanylate cyclase domain-containing protein n=1 Tax=Pseudorhodoferax sp. TaxID=1993553 RepID=UPI002DD65022|nr:diguanylate cyclase [Pseudorhodoferax sp.]
MEAAPGRRGPAALWRRRSHREWLFWGLAWLVVLAIALHAAWRAREATVAHDLERLQGQAQAVELHLVRQLQAIGDALLSVRQLVSDQERPVSPQLKLLADAMPGVGALQITDHRGRVLAASRLELAGHDASQRDYFIAARDGGNPGALYLSPPFRTVLNNFTAVLSRAIRHPDGSFAGVVSASLDPDYFEIVLRAVLYAPDARASIVHGNGTIIVSSPLREARPGTSLDVAGSMFRQHMESGREQSLLQGRVVGRDEHRMMAMRTVAPSPLQLDQPLVVRMSRLSDAVLAPWWSEARNELLLLLLAMAISGAWLRWHQGRRQLQETTERDAARAERESARRLEFGLRGADLGLWEWNLADDTFSVNARGLEMLGYPPSEEPLRAEFWHGLLHADDIAETDQAIAAHLRGETPSYRLEHRYRHRAGHWIWVLTHAMVMQRSTRGRPLRVVGTHLDISERKRSQLELERMNAQLAALSLTDGLTGVANRRQFDQTLMLEWARGLRSGRPLALLMLDVDHFKRYNDHMGHPEGDACLRAVAQVLSACVRQPVEKLMRYGGEEFAVLLVDADAHVGARVAQRCLDGVAQARLPHPDSPLGPWVSLSVGVASLVPQAELLHEQLVLAADAALYRAKQHGRARYEIATQDDALRRVTGMQPLMP